MADPRRGILRPLEQPAMKRGHWCVTTPLASQKQPGTEAAVKALAKDVLHGLKALHAAGFVHRDVRAPNVLEVTLRSFPIPMGCFAMLLARQRSAPLPDCILS